MWQLWRGKTQSILHIAELQQAHQSQTTHNAMLIHTNQ